MHARLAVMLSLPVLCSVTPMATGSLGCGGCYVNLFVNDLRSDPEKACLTLSASEVDTCDGSYSVTVANACGQDFTVAQGPIPDGTSLALARVSGGESDTDGRYSFEGTLGSEVIRISWVLQDPE